VAGGFQIVDRSELERQRGIGSQNDDGKVPQQNAGIPPAYTTPSVERVVVPAAFHTNTGSRNSSVSGQSVTWGEACLFPSLFYYSFVIIIFISLFVNFR